MHLILHKLIFSLLFPDRGIVQVNYVSLLLSPDLFNNKFFKPRYINCHKYRLCFAITTL